MITLQQETFSAWYEEALPMINKHADEIAHYKDIEPLADVSVYLKAAENNLVRVYTARTSERMIGYVVTFVRKHIHYKNSLQSFVDLVYLDPEFRGLKLGKELVVFVDQCLKDEGVQLNTHHVKLKHPALGKLLEQMGYEAVETTYSRRLD